MSYKNILFGIVNKIIVYETYLQEVSAETDDWDELFLQINIDKIRPDVPSEKWKCIHEII